MYCESASNAAVTQNPENFEVNARHLTVKLYIYTANLSVTQQLPKISGTPVFTVEGAVPYRLGYVVSSYVKLSVKVGYGARHS